MNGLLISPDTISIVQLTREDRWVRLGLWLAREFTGGALVEFAPDATVPLEGIDEVSALYRRANWISGVASGALYTFRTLSLPRQHLVVTELSGRLGASDMGTLAMCSSAAVALLAGKPIPNLPLDGWTMQSQVVGRSPTPSRPDQNLPLPTPAVAGTERVAAELNRPSLDNQSGAENGTHPTARAASPQPHEGE